MEAEVEGEELAGREVGDDGAAGANEEEEEDNVRAFAMGVEDRDEASELENSKDADGRERSANIRSSAMKADTSATADVVRTTVGSKNAEEDRMEALGNGESESSGTLHCHGRTGVRWPSACIVLGQWLLCLPVLQKRS